MNRTLRLDELHELIVAVLVAAGTARENADPTAAALVAAEADGLGSHGASRVPFYADHLLAGKVDGRALPEVTRPAAAAVRVDAHFGFAYPAIRAGLAAAGRHVPDTGIVGVAITRSHHFGAAGYHVESLAANGLVGLAFSNSPSAMAPWGGSKGTFGTNPIAFACPRRKGPPLVIDLSLSQVARGKIVLAAQQGQRIPEGWAFAADGSPTTDPQAALAGTMAPLAGVKGAALALMVEILTAALTGANFAYQAGSFFSTDGPVPGIGQLFVVIDPQAFNPGFADRVEDLLAAILAQPGTRLPGTRRLEHRARAREHGVTIPDTLYEDLLRRSGRV